MSIWYSPVCSDGKMQKCHMCFDRISHQLEPTCVHTCPTKALKFGDINEILDSVELKIVERYSIPLIKTKI